MRKKLSVVITLSVLALVGMSGTLRVNAQEDAAKPADKVEVAAKAESIDMADGKIVAIKPDSWHSVPPKSRIVELEYAAPNKEESAARITIMASGGTIEQNIERWIGQFDGAKKEDAKIEEREIEGGKIHIVELTGTSLQKMGGPFAPGPTTKIENQTMLAAILETKEHGNYYIKMLGGKDVVAKLADEMKAMLDTVKVQ